MNQSHECMTCAEFQDRLADLIAHGSAIYAHPHLDQCSTCRRLLVDLDMIAEAAARHLPGKD